MTTLVERLGQIELFSELTAKEIKLSLIHISEPTRPY